MKLLKILLITAAAGIVLIILAVGGAFFLLKTETAQVYLQERINHAIPGSITWSQLDVDLWDGRMEFHDLVLSGPGNHHLAGIGQLYIDIAWAPLLKHRLVVEQVRIVNPMASMVMDAAGRLNLQQAFLTPDPDKSAAAESGSKFPFEIEIISLELEAGHIKYALPHKSREIDAPKIFLTGTGLILPVFTGHLSLKTGEMMIRDPQWSGAATVKAHADLQGLSGGNGYPDFSIGLELGAIKIMGPGLARPLSGTLVATAGVVGDRISADAIKVEIDQHWLNGRGSYEMHSENVQGTITGHVPDMSELLSYFGISGPGGDVTLSAGIKGNRAEPVVDLELSGKALVFKDSKPGASKETAGLTRPLNGTVKVTAGVAGDRISADAIKIEIGRLRLDGKCSYEMHSEKIQGTLTGHVPDIAELVSHFDISGPGGDVTLSARIKGNRAAPVVDLELSGKALTFKDLKLGALNLGALNLEAGVDSNRVVLIKRFALENQDSQISAAGTISLPDPKLKSGTGLPMDITLQLNPVNLPDFSGNEKITGEITGTVHLHGDLTAPRASMALAAKDLAVNQNRIGDVDARGHFSDGELVLEPLLIQNGRSRLSVAGRARFLAAGTLAPLKDPLVDVTLSGDPLHLADFRNDLDGLLVLTGQLAGPVTQLSGKIAVKGKNLSMAGQAIEGIELTAHLEASDIYVDQLQVTLAPGEMITGNGKFFPRQSAGAFEVSSQGVSLAHIRNVNAQDFVSGRLAFDLSGKGTLTDPQMDGVILITNIAVNQQIVEDIKLQLSIKDHLAKVWGRPGFDLEASYHLDKRVFDAVIQLDDTKLDPWFTMGGLKDFGGSVSGTIQAHGIEGRMDKARVSVDLSRVKIVSGNQDWVNIPEIKAELDGTVFEIPGVAATFLQKGTLFLTGRGDFAGDMNLALDGAIPVKSMVPFLLPDADAWGDIKISAKMAGTLKQPDLNADLILDRLGMSLSDSGQRLHDLSGHLRITPEALHLEKITGGLDQGTFSLAGTVALEKFKPHSWNIKATALQFPVKIPDTLDLLLESNLEFNGITDKTAEQAAGQFDVRGDIRGDIRILEGLYYKDVKLNLLQGIREPKRTGAPDSSTGKISFLHGLTLDIGIQSRQPVRVENNMAVMEIVPVLRLSGTLDNPVISGRAQADEGVITYQETEFEIQTAVIDFVNPYRIEPDMDIQATADVRDWTVMLHILGTPENLMFELTSTPPLEHGDILSLLLFKKTVDELTKGSSGASFSVEQGVADLVAEKLSAGVRDATGLDTVELKYREGAGAVSDDIGVTLGKELSRRISVKYEARTQKGETIQQASTEYRLLENLLMSAFQDTAGNFGGELTFRLEFR